MNPLSFRQTRSPRWAETLALVERAERSRFRDLDKRELDALALGYRRLASDLAVAQREFPTSDVTFDLNQLVARAHGVVYRRRGLRWREARHFLVHVVPATIRKRSSFITVAALLFVVPLLASYAVARLDPSLASSYVPEGIVSAAENGRVHTDDILSMTPSGMISSQVMTNNIGVVFAAFAMGILLGLGSIYILVFNGLSVGTIVGFYANHGLAGRMYDFMFAHGVIELSAICIAGGAGLLLGDALVAPGPRTRREALEDQGRDAVRIVIGLVPVLIVAGVVEGYISPSPVYASEAKTLIGLALGTLMWAWILTGGRTGDGRDGQKPVR